MTANISTNILQKCLFSLNKHMNFDVAIATEKVVFSKPLLYIQVDFFWMRHIYGGGHWLEESSRQDTSR